MDINVSQMVLNNYLSDLWIKTALILFVFLLIWASYDWDTKK